jgi:hypothetical protein
VNRYFVFFVLHLGLAGACSKPTVVTPTPTTQTPTASSSICAPAASSQGRPVNDPNGPYFHRVVVGTTSDGVRVSNVRSIIEHASVPDGVRAPDGRTLVYYVNGEDGGVWVASYAGGAATRIGAISINGVSRPAGVVDPDAYVIDGRIRLAYLASSGPGAGNQRAMCLADSTDGVSFSVVATALAVTEMWTDPSVTRLRDGRWLMAISSGTTTVLARSTDGLVFTSGERLTYGGVPEVTTLEDGRARLYVCANGIVSYVLADNATTWALEGTVIPPGGLACDPSRISGTDLFV